MWLCTIRFYIKVLLSKPNEILELLLLLLFVRTDRYETDIPKLVRLI